MTEQIIGSTRTFVLAKGFTQAGPHAALIGEDDTRRLFAELYADPDRSEVRPQEAYQAMLSSMQPGWSMRCYSYSGPTRDHDSHFKTGAKMGLSIQRRPGYIASGIIARCTGIFPAVCAPHDP